MSCQSVVMENAASMAYPDWVEMGVFCVWKMLRSYPSLKDVTVHLPHAHWKVNTELVRRHCRYLRNRDAVNIKGMLPGDAEELDGLMVSKKPVVDLAKIYDAAGRYLRAMMGDSYQTVTAEME